ncbi:MAG TPA: copper ion binding protein, partial [Pirellulales bacterium]|nr:copper ion binding protein [Pirellulales bacterium]
MSQIELPIEGMTCEHCVRSVQAALERVAGVQSASVDLAAKRAVVELDPNRASRDDLVHAVEAAGYHAGDGQAAPRQLVSLERQPPRKTAAPAAGELAAVSGRPEVLSGEPEASASVSPSSAVTPSGAAASNHPEADASGSPLIDASGSPLGDASASPSPVESPIASKRLLLDIEGMHCASCVSRVEGALQGVPGVATARVNLALEQASVEFDPRRAKLEDLLAAVGAGGYRA